MPERPVLQPLDLPDSVLVDVAVLVEPAFPPLVEGDLAGEGLLGRFVQPGLHHAPETALRRGEVVGDGDDVLELRVVQEEPEDRPVVPLHEPASEPLNVEPVDARPALVQAPAEVDLAVVAEQRRNFGVVTLVEVVAVRVVQPADLLLRFEQGDPVCQRRHGLPQVGVGCLGHGVPP